MSEAVISLGPTLQPIPPGSDWTTLTLARPGDGRTLVTGQFASTLPSTIAQRATLCEVQLVRRRAGVPDDPTGQDDRAFAFTFDALGKVRIVRRQNWTYHDELRTYADEALVVQARHPGPVPIDLEWVLKLVLLRPEGSR